MDIRYIQKLTNKLKRNHNDKLRSVDVRIHFTEHFIQRCHERLDEIDLTNTCTIVNKLVNNHLCEIFFTTHLNIIHFTGVWKNLYVCFTVDKDHRKINFRTVIKNKTSGDYSGYTTHKFDFNETGRKDENSIS